MRRREFIACIALCAPAVAAAQRTFEDAAGWAARFDTPERIASQKPDEVVRLLALAPDAVVADIGAGTGFYAVRFARALPRGKVLAVDIEPAMVEHLRERARQEGLANLHVGPATYTDPRIGEPVDLAFLANVHGLYARPGDYYERLERLLKPGGRIAIIGARPGAGGAGPSESIRTAPERVREDMARAGMRLVADHALMADRYFLVFERARPPG